MVPNQAPPIPATITTMTTTTTTKVTKQQRPDLTRSSTVPNLIPQLASNRTLLAPEDAIYQGSPPRKQSPAVKKLQHGLRMTNGLNGDAPAPLQSGRQKSRHRSRSRMRKVTWKKLLWVKQSYPDNYTDQATFLEHLQRNPRLQPYDFWPLVADSTVIVQHVCSVVIFIVCFIGIVQDRISPVGVVGWGSVATFLGWVLWDWWLGQDDLFKHPNPVQLLAPQYNSTVSSASSTSNLSMHNFGSTGSTPNLGAHHHNPSSLVARHSHSASASSIQSATSQMTDQSPRLIPIFPAGSTSSLSHRTSIRLSTAKSALLIYFTLLGLSPILKSLTRSTSSDSIWAMSFLLFTINIFFFDYKTPEASSGNKNIPASLSTNAALMASTVLASRLPSTGQVFSLTLFSIEVFGLFPVFRRYAKQRTWQGHVTLTGLLIVGASGGVGLCMGHGGDGEGMLDFPWKAGLTGVVVGVISTCLAMGVCSWWLIGLQKYKNEIHGPWDPARPIIRRQWDDY
ncbi:phosphatidylinositol N-acetylglucosaminyltransferase-domain-containing protein [Amylocarpus encephaloides]|uniref:Phosphatidylinositol N-acetylglucosaminyltransferase-domain-containing protein n=1 Tax=Amylocarpus encephaloides TaxID=45428 RepID=A0A9P7YHS2_9HELO|nr:phosphatidylinositol N-acetylglucosaminyltransferase-domain-containing protein [Amylocarpus encephaloides]